MNQALSLAETAETLQKLRVNFCRVARRFHSCALIRHLLRRWKLKLLISNQNLQRQIEVQKPNEKKLNLILVIKLMRKLKYYLPKTANFGSTLLGENEANLASSSQEQYVIEFWFYDK